MNRTIGEKNILIAFEPYKIFSCLFLLVVRMLPKNNMYALLFQMKSALGFLVLALLAVVAASSSSASASSDFERGRNEVRRKMRQNISLFSVIK